MSVLLFAEYAQGGFKKAVLEAATYAHDLAEKMGTDLHAVVVGSVDEADLPELGKYGVSKIYRVQHHKLESFINKAYAAGVYSVARETKAGAVVMAQTYNGRAIAPRVAVKLNAAAFSGLIELADPANGFKATRLAYSGKGVETLSTKKDIAVITVKTNSYKVEENPQTISVEDFSFIPNIESPGALAKEIVKASEGVSLTEAEIVVSAGRGMKGGENWGIIEELAQLLGAATACSKPVADMDWRPHHEHVGQTGIQISPDLYFAIGISGAIQHLAGVSASKTIVVINKDPEAPFFKIADYGIVGDLFDVVPKLNAALKAAKG